MDSQWIGFCGSVIGGFLTLLGVLITIYYEHRVRNKDYEMKYRPILSINKSVFECKTLHIENPIIYSIIKNVGESEAKDIKIKIESKEIKDKSFSCDILAKGKDIKVPLYFNSSLKNTENLIFTINIKYYSNMNKEYTYDSKIKISIKNNEISIYSLKEENVTKENNQ